MALILIGLAILMILVLIAFKMALTKEDHDIDPDPDRERKIHVSGIYSIVRESPRGDLAALRPSEDTLRRYLATVSADITGASITERDREALIDHWKAQTEANLRTIEEGDKRGVTYYFYSYPNGVCPVCKSFIKKGNFVTREEIYNFTQIIPPFHLGCTCELNAHIVGENMRETTTTGMLPLFESNTPPPLPDPLRGIYCESR